MPAINEMVLRKIQYDPETGAVAYLLEHPMGALMPGSTEERLEEVAGHAGGNWGNEECLRDAQRCVDEHPTLGGLGYVVVMRPRRVRPPDEPGRPAAALPESTDLENAANGPVTEGPAANSLG